MNIVEFRFGRNVKGVPMNDVEWALFLTDARMFLEGVADGVQNSTTTKLTQWVETHRAKNATWVNSDGETESEESAVTTLYSDADDFDSTHPDFALTASLLEEFASELARIFRQEAVAVVFGKSVLATQKVGV